MLRFANPTYLWFLLAVPAIAALFVLLHFFGRRRLRRFVSDPLLNQLAPDLSHGKRAWKKSFVLASLACLILTAADPQVGTRLEEIKREGIDLFVVLDVSLSMKAEDIKPSRLEKAKRDISSLLKKLTGDRVGLIVFAGDAFVQFPLTADYSAADLFLSAVDVDAVPIPGTMIGSAIKLALKSFETDLPTQKAIVVVSDGENTEGDVMGAIEDAKQAHVRVYTVGTGTLDGSPIPIYNDQGQQVDYKRDGSGSIVLTKLDETMLQQVAESTGGTYRRATSGGNEIDDIYKELESIGKTEFGVKQISGYESRYQYPLAFAIFFLILEVVLSERRGKLMIMLKRLIPIAGVILLVTMVTGPTADAQTLRSTIRDGNRAYEKGKYSDAEVEYKKALQQDAKSHQGLFNLGDALYKQQRYDEAMREYNNAAVATKSPESKASSYYNLGNSFFRANKFPESIEAYKQALRTNPDDEDARYNLQLAIDRMKQQQQNKNQQKNQKDQQQQNQQQNQDQKQNQNQNQQQQQQQPQNQSAKQDQTRTQQTKNQMPKEEADRILEALRNSEKQIQKELRKRPAARVHVEKDW
ncbi:MAG TPA: VWA domain-containing protein [Bacteroidota bacterium]|nr:VWA domain-containing protein [Bacteroidota bacterium]